MRDNWKQLFKLLLGTGMVLMDVNRREIKRKVSNRVDDLRDVARDKYDDLRGVARDRYDDVYDRIHGRRNYAAPIGGFLIGMGVGVGLGMLFAPAPGEETRQTLKEQAANLKDRVSFQASNIRDRASEKASQFKDQVKDAVRSETSPNSPFSRPA